MRTQTQRKTFIKHLTIHCNSSLLHFTSLIFNSFFSHFSVYALFSLFISNLLLIVLLVVRPIFVLLPNTSRNTTYKKRLPYSLYRHKAHSHKSKTASIGWELKKINVIQRMNVLVIEWENFIQFKKTKAMIKERKKTTKKHIYWRSINSKGCILCYSKMINVIRSKMFFEVLWSIKVHTIHLNSSRKRKI